MSVYCDVCGTPLDPNHDSIYYGEGGAYCDKHHPAAGKLDQYGYAVPDDLVPLPGYHDIMPEDVNRVENARWYESADGVILVSMAEVGDLGIDFDEDEDIGGVDRSEIRYIADCLHRGNPLDGFYHA